jgi:hypothetical protein
MSSVWPRARSRLRESQLEAPARRRYRPVRPETHAPEQGEDRTALLADTADEDHVRPAIGANCSLVGARCRCLDRNGRPLPPAAAGLSPLEQMVDGAEAVRDAVLAPMANQEDADVVELFAAM